MSPIVSIIMGSTSDLPVMEKAAQLLNDLHVPFEMNALSAHRTPEAVEEFAKGARKRGIKVIIAAAGMAAINGAMNAAILAVQMLALSDKELAEAFTAYKEGLKKKIVKANEDLKEVKYEYKVN